MRILVTGGAGYIGSITTRLLLDRGHECIVLDTLERGWSAAVDPRADFVQGSVADESCVRTVVSGCDAVMHLAGYIEVAESVRNPEMYFRNNAVGPQAMLDAMIGTDCSAIVFSSTAAVYGEPERVPIAEDAPTIPVNPYGESKLAFERMLDEYAGGGLRSVRFRYFNVAGAWPDGSRGEAHDPESHLIPRILRAIQSGQERFEVFGGDYPTRDGTCVRDYIHVLDLAHAHAIALEALRDGLAGGVFNLGNGDGYTNLEILKACGETTGRACVPSIVGRRPGDPAALIASAEHAGDVLGWRPEYPDIREMIAHAWEWHLAHPNGYR